MARLILCTPCKDETKKRADGYGEHFILLSGEAKRDFYCDQCGEEIKEGGSAHCCCLLDSSDHFNADAQHPRRWAGHYIEVEK